MHRCSLILMKRNKMHTRVMNPLEKLNINSFISYRQLSKTTIKSLSSISRSHSIIKKICRMPGKLKAI